MHTAEKLAFALTVCAGLASAQDTWTGATDNQWGNGNNWFLFSVPAPGADVTFDANSTANLTIDLGSDIALNKLTLVDPAGPVSLFNFSLTLGAGGLDMAAATQDLDLQSSLVLSGPQNWNVAAGRQVTVGSPLTNAAGVVWNLDGAGLVRFTNSYLGALGLVKNGGATLELAGNKNFSGGITVNGGTLRVNAGGWYVNPFSQFNVVTVQTGATLRTAYAHSLGVDQNTFILNEGTLSLGAENYISALQLNGGTVTNGELRTWGGVMPIGASTNGGFIYSPFTLVGDATLQVADGAADADLTLAGNVQGGAVLTKTGPGTLAIAGVTTYGNSTLVNAGKLAVVGGGAISNSAMIQVAAGATVDVAAASGFTISPVQTLAGSGRVAGNLSAGPGGRIQPGAAAAPGVIRFANDLTLLGGSTSIVDMAALTGVPGTQWDLQQVEGALAFDVSAGPLVRIQLRSSAVLPTLPNTSYTITVFQVTGAITGFSNEAVVVESALVSPYPVVSGRVEQVGNDLQVVFLTGTGVVATAWDPVEPESGVQDGDGVWNNVNTNWHDGAGNIVWPGNSASAQFGAGTNSGGSYTVDVAAPVGALGLQFPAGSTYTLGGTGTLSLGGGVISSGSDATLGVRVAGAGFIKSGTGSVTLVRTTGANTYTGPIQVDAGTVAAAGTVGDGVIRGDVQVNAGGTFRLGGNNIVVNSAVFTLAAGGALNMGGFSDAVGALVGAGTVVSNTNGTGLYLDNAGVGVDRVFSGSVLGGGRLYLRTDVAQGGTQWLNGTNELGYVGIEGPSTLRFSSNGVTRCADIIAVNPGGNVDGAQVIVEEGHDLTCLRIQIQEAGGHNGQFHQRGGRVTATDSGGEEGAIRIGHWGGDENSTYYLNGGSLFITNAGTYGKLSMCIDGSGYYNQAGGTATVKWVSMNERPGGGRGQFALSNGLLRVGTGGFTTESVEYGLIFAGGTLSAWGDYAVAVTSEFTGAAGDFKIDPAGQTITWQREITGAGGATLQGAGTLLVNAAGLYTGTTFVNGATLGGTGSVAGLVQLNAGGTVRPGLVAAPGALQVGQLNAAAGGAISVLANGTGSVLRVAGTDGFTVPAGSASALVHIANATLPIGTYTVVDYAGTVQGGTVTNLVIGQKPLRSSMNLVDNPGNTSIDLNIVSTGERIRWTGAADANWNVNTTTNWITDATLLTTAYLEEFGLGDRVLFDDTAAGNFSIVLATSVAPAEVVVSNTANDYAFSGGGSIGGAVGLLKLGSGTLTMGLSNSFAGGVNVAAGTLVIPADSALGLASGPLRLQAGATLRAQGPVAAPATRAVTVGSDATAGAATLDTGTNAVSIASALTPAAGSSTSLRKLGAGTLTLTAESTYTGGTEVVAGTLVLTDPNGNDTGVVRGSLTVQTGATVRTTANNSLGWGTARVTALNLNEGLADNRSAGDQGWGITINMQGGELRSNGGTNSATGSYYSLGGGSAVNVLASTNTALITGRINLRDNTGSLPFTVADSTPAVDLLVAAALVDAGGNTIRKLGPGVMKLTGTNTYTGGTIIGGGVLEVDRIADSVESRIGTAGGTGNYLALQDGVLRYAGADSNVTARSLWIDQAQSGSGFDIAQTNGVLTLSPGGGNVIYPVTKTGPGTLILNGVLAGASAVTVAGGALELNAAHTYSGPTTISGGLLRVNGSCGTGAVTIAATATLAGTGTLAGPVSQDGIIAPGAGIGKLILSNQVTASATAIYRFEVGGTNAPTDYDQLVVGDVHTLQGTLEVVVTNGYVPASGDRFVILTNSGLGGLLFGTFSSVSAPALDPGLGWEVQYTGTESASLVVTGTVSGGLSAYEQWAQSIPNPAERGEQADPDGDGYANLLEYSQGTDATNSSDNAKLSLLRTNGQFLVLFNRVNSATDIVYEVEGAYLPTNNALWLGIATNVIGSWGGSTNVNDNNTAAVHRVLVTDLEIGTNRSLRLKVTRP